MSVITVNNEKSVNLNESDEDVVLEKNNKLSFKYLIHRRLPITRWLPKYTNFFLISDFIAGITLGLTMIPQSLAYAALAGLTPEYGLYSSFIGGFLYIFFGTIREVSIGATSLMSLITFQYTQDMPVQFVILLTFLAGCVELLMGIFNFGFLVDFISIPVTSGFTSATSIIIILSQLPGLLGVKIKSESMINVVTELYKKRDKILVPDTLLGITSIIFLLSFRKLKDINWSFLKKKNIKGGLIIEKVCWFLSVARNAIIVFLTSFLTFYYQDGDKLLFVTAGSVTPGIPTLKLPPFSTQHGNVTYNFIDMCKHLNYGIVMVPIIAVLTNVAIAKAFVKDGTIEATQEMLTLGCCNIIGSFVSAMPSCGAFTRSAVANTSGIQTPLAGIYSGIMTLLALSFLTPYFGFIPKPTLSAILISAVVFLIDLKTFKSLWRKNKKELMITTSTFFIAIFFNVESGLICGTFFHLLFLLYSLARPLIKIKLRSTIKGDKYAFIKPEKIVYPAASYFINKVTKVSRKLLCPIVIDFENIRSIDYTTINEIEKLLKTFHERSQLIYFLNVSSTFTKLKHLKHFNSIQDESQLFNLLSQIHDKNPKCNESTSPNSKELDESIELLTKNS